MGFFDDINKIVSDIGEKTLQKTKEISDVARFNTFVADEERKLNSAYCQIGKMYIAKYGNNCDEEFAALISTVTECTEKIMEYKSQICEIKGVQQCPNCGAEISRGFTFCSACGKQLGSAMTEGTGEFKVEGTAGNVEIRTEEAVEAVETTAEENNAGNVEEDMPKSTITLQKQD